MPKLLENARENIIEEGRKTLISSNYYDFSIRNIAKKCNIATGTIYNYFKSKDELVLEIITDDWVKTLDLVDKLTTDDTELKTKLEKIYLSLQNFLDKYISVFYQISEQEGYKTKDMSRFSDIYLKMEMLLDNEKLKGHIHSPLSTKKLSHLIISNFTYMCKTKYISFDEFYNTLVL